MAKQGKFDFQMYVTYIMDLATLLDTDRPILEKLLEQQIFKGTNLELKELWACELNMPTTLVEQLQRVSQLEQAMKLGNCFHAPPHSHTTTYSGDPMDLLVLKGAPTLKKDNPNFHAWCKSNNTCWGCRHKDTKQQECPKCSKKGGSNHKGKLKAKELENRNDL